MCVLLQLERLAKRLKKEKVNVDIVIFGEQEFNEEVLTPFVNIINGKEGTKSVYYMCGCHHCCMYYVSSCTLAYPYFTVQTPSYIRISVYTVCQCPRGLHCTVHAYIHTCSGV